MEQNIHEHTLLLVDDEPNNLELLRQILGNHYNLKFAKNGQTALDATKKHKPDMILLDIMMPEVGGYDVCTELKARPATAKIPVIFVTAKGEIEDESRGFDVGGVDYITKPVSSEIVLRRIQTHLQLVRTEELEKMTRSAIDMLSEAGHYNDGDTGVHIFRMAEYAAAIAKKAGWSTKKWERLKHAAPMHDTGKIGIPDDILKAPRKLTSEEWNIMKTHSRIGYDILKKSDTPLFLMAAEIALFHHEKWDGSGYPQQLSGESIPEAALIVAIADVFDALTMKRPYKEAWPVEKAFAEIEKRSGIHFSPRHVETFRSIYPEMRAIIKKWEVK